MTTLHPVNDGPDQMLVPASYNQRDDKGTSSANNLECELEVSSDEHTSTVANFYTGLKFISKTHFYGRAAAEENFSDFLSALLRAVLLCGRRCL